MVKEMRVPSSSSSSSAGESAAERRRSLANASGARTDSDWLDLDALLNMSAIWVVGVLVAEHGLTAQGVDEGCPTCKRGIFSSRRRFR